MLMKVGTRKSPLALLQTELVLKRLQQVVPSFRYELVPQETLGDRDLQTDLKVSPGDFFTRDLDEALRSGVIDCAIHSAKDLPDPVAADLDWFWLPWTEDPRDAWVLKPGRSLADLPANPIIGVSSARREAYCLQRFPAAILRPIRGNIQSRLQQLDAGDFDAMLMAGAALNRLGLSERIVEWIETSELKVPDGQGYLAVTFRKGDEQWLKLRKLFTKAVRFVSAGVGSADYCTLAGVNALKDADVCLYDVLMDESLTSYLPETAEKVFVGKRCGAHSVNQTEITQLIADYARQGKRVVRLKGGDAGLFGRLVEEIDCLDALELAYKVYAGVSTLTVATTGTGLLLTRRGVSRGFTVMTPRAEKGSLGGIGREQRERLPLVLFMAVQVAAQEAAQLLAEGWPEETPVAIVFAAGGPEEQVVMLNLVELCAGKFEVPEAPGLVIIGSAAEAVYPEKGALGGTRILLTCSEAVLPKAIRRVIDFGGKPLSFPLIRLEPTPVAEEQLRNVAAYDWLVLTSPSAVRCLMAMDGDVRKLPKIMTCGPGTRDELIKWHIQPELTPSMNYSAVGLAETLAGYDFTGKKILRLRSDKAGPLLADVLRGMGAEVEDVLLYRNEPVRYERLPEFDAVFFASASAVEVFVEQFGVWELSGKTVCVIGQPTAEALLIAGREPDVMGWKATAEGVIESLAAFDFNQTTKERT